MIRRRDLVRALADMGASDWVLVERDQHIGCADDATQLRRAEHRLKWRLTVHVDAPTGRGSAHVAIDAAEGDAEAVGRQAVTLARASIGPAWVTRPTAAPARVTLADPSIATRAPLDVATEIVRSVERPAGVTVLASAQMLHETVHVTSRQGLETRWSATLLSSDVVVGLGDRSIAIRCEARQLAELGLAPAIQRAIEDLRLLGNATASMAGDCTLVLRADAMLHAGLGVWAAFVTQADATVERQGLTRYRERTPVATGAAAATPPLSIASDGALDFGLYSAPLGDQGEAVRRFTLVERGIAAGLGLSPREAALRGRDPNGGVRNLVVAKGEWTGTLDRGAARVVDVRRLRSLSLDPYTGDASLELALAIDHAEGPQHAITGGSVRIDMIAALARARRSAQLVRRGAYVGPDAIVIEHAELIA